MAWTMDICILHDVQVWLLAMAWAAESLAVPTSVWLGLLPLDISRLSIMPSSMKQLSAQDCICREIVDLNNWEYVREELEILWDMGRKAEIQQEVEKREIGFLAKQFLPRKIAEGGWVRGRSYLSIGGLGWLQVFCDSSVIRQ